MPLYDYQCEEHGYFEGRALMAQSSDPAPCPRCGQPSAKVILHAPRIFAESFLYEPYECPVTGKWIEGRHAHRENLARTGCHILEAGETDDEVKRRERQEKEAFAKIDEAIDRTAGELGLGV